ncbi:MAG: hypothetical protein J0I12_03040 [Candidatus Eremiobacteraeota bacterium]|nr:hypothetical protein [Candidatus Eremiobacteraeota bacterium]
MQNNPSDLRKFVEEKPLTSLGGAVLFGFAVGSGVALPILFGASMSRSGIGGILKSWLRQEAEHGLREWLKSQQKPVQVESESPSALEGHEQSDNGSPGQTPLARQVREELDGYSGTKGRVSQSVQGIRPSD